MQLEIIRRGAACIQVHGAFASTLAMRRRVPVFNHAVQLCACSRRAVHAKTELSLDKLPLHSALSAFTMRSADGVSQRVCVARGAIVDAVVAATKASLVLHLHRVEWLFFCVCVSVSTQVSNFM